MTVDDMILSVEAQLIYDRTVGLETVDGDLTRWRGVVRSPVGPVAFEIQIPPEFPRQAPIVKILTRIKHPNLNPDGTLRLRILNRWRPTNHVYQVVDELIRSMQDLVVPISEEEIKRVPVRNLTALRQQVTILREKVQKREQELQDLKRNRNRPLTADLIERSKTDIENELWEIETQFDRSEIDARTYAKKYVDARKRLEILYMASSKTS